VTIRIYPSRLPGEPLETHEHKATTIHQWLVDNVMGYEQDIRHPVAVEVNGKAVPSSEWALCHIDSKSDVRIYPVPYGTGLEIAAWAAVAVAVASAAYTLVMMSQMNKGVGSASGGDSMELSPAKANTAKLGDPIREVLGRVRIFPDYLVQPVSRFDRENPQIYRTEMFLCVGYGSFAINQSSIKIGNTPISSFGEDVSYRIYPPGADVGADRRSENWFNSTEVGGTTSGTAGLDLASTGPAQTGLSADAISLSGSSLSVISSSQETAMPESWKEGTVLTITAPSTFTVASEAGVTVVYGDMTELVPAIGMPVTLSWSNSDYDLLIASYHAGSPAVPGVGGNAASITANAAPQTYDFSGSPSAFTLTWAGASYVISLTANYVTITGLADEISEQLTGSGLKASANNVLLSIGEIESPYSGNSIGYSNLPVVLFGDSPMTIAGVASTGGSPAVLPNITLSYDNGVGFSGLPTGPQRVALSARGKQYRITAIDGVTIDVERLLVRAGSTVADKSWPGFTPRVLLDATITGLNDQSSWAGPFLCCPVNEKTDHVELNFVYPQGLVDIGSKDGKWHWHDVQLSVQYREVGASAWQSVIIKHGNRTVNEIGYTESIIFPANASYEIRVKRDTPVWGGTTRDAVQWQSMRAKLADRKTSYSGTTTIGLTIRTGNRLAAQSDRRVNLIGTRLYDGHTSRSISGAIYHVLKDLGYTDGQIDYAAINALENRHWTPRGELFDWSAESDNTSGLDVLQKVTNAGMGYFLLSDGLASAGREGIKNWSGVISPHEQTEELQTSFKALSKDDYDGVDVTYINSTTWAEETIKCRLTDKPDTVKVENYTLDGVTDPDRAYRIGMRRLMKYCHQRLTHTTSTEMDALCYDYGDRIILTDDIPGSKTISCLVVDVQSDTNKVVLHVSEPLDWSFENPRCIIRFQDGSASPLLVVNRIDDYTLSVANTTDIRLGEWVTNDPAVELPRVIFCSSTRVGYSAIMESIEPGTDGTCQVNALQYTPLLYQHDDDAYPGII